MQRSSVGAQRVLSVFCADAARIGGIQSFAKELTVQLSGAGWESILCFAAEPSQLVRSYLEGDGCSFEVVPCWPDGRVASIRAFASVMRRRRPDIVHVYLLGVLTPFPWVARLLGARQFFLTDELSRPEGHQSRPVSWPKRFVARAITSPIRTVICASEFVENEVRTAGFVDPRKARVIYNAVDLKRRIDRGQDMRRRLGIPQDSPVVLQVSWLIPQKGIDDLIDAAGIVATRDPRVRFVLAGEGWNGDHYRALARSRGLESNIVFAGMIEDPVGQGLFAMADVVCQPSRWREAFGFTIAEAMLCGKPVVGTTTGGIPEVIEDGVTGVLVPVRSPEQLADAISKLLGDAPLCVRMGTAGRQAVEERFNLEKTVSELVHLYGIEQTASVGDRAAGTAAGA